jgi:hypothetical protein
MDIKSAELMSGIIMLIFILALFITFLILKLTAVIAWGWLWVTSPLWILVGLGIIGKVLGLEP